MYEVRNPVGKLVCKVDAKSRALEIVFRGYATIVRFNDDGTISVKNKKLD